MTASASEKAALREQLSRRRLALDGDQRFLASRQVEGHVEGLLAGRRAVAGFSATQNEVDLSHLYARLLEGGVHLYFPRVVRRGHMVFVRVDTMEALQPGAFGIAEPSGEPGDVSAIDTFLVPGLAFDRFGARLGFGGGYYDRALEPLQNERSDAVSLIGIGYSWQVVDERLPTDEWDVLLDRLVTEQGVVLLDTE